MRQQEREIRLYLLLRLVLLYSVLVSTVLYQRAGSVSELVIVKTYLLIFFTFVMTSVFVLLFERIQKVKYFLYSQIGYDIIFTTALIYYSGTFDTLYSIFYFFNIISAAILFLSRGALVAALVSAGFYLGINVADFDKFSYERYFTLFTSLTGFIAISLLSGKLTEELQKSRIKIRRLEQVSEEIVESLDSGLIGLDAHGVIRKINRTAEDLLGLNAKNVLDQPLSQALPSLVPFARKEIQNHIHEMNLKGIHKRLLIHCVELDDKVNVEKSLLLLIRDLSDVLSLQERIRRQERLASVGRLAAGVAHEIRNPLASISGSAQLLSMNPESEDEKYRLLDIIMRETDRVDRLVHQLLRFSRPSTMKREEIELKPFLAQCLEALKTRQEFQEIQPELIFEVDDGAKLCVNPDELSEVISNLLVNALQALRDQKENLKKKIRLSAKVENNHIELMVTDNGPGVPKDFKNRIFDPFFTTKSYGTGLGLAQVHKIVRDHDGHVDVETEEGKGTVMKIRLPA